MLANRRSDPIDIEVVGSTDAFRSALLGALSDGTLPP